MIRAIVLALLVALSLALVCSCGPMPSHTGDAGVDAAVSPLVGRWRSVNSTPVSPPTTWELEVMPDLRARLRVTVADPCFADSVSSEVVMLVRNEDAGPLAYTVRPVERCAAVALSTCSIPVSAPCARARLALPFDAPVSIAADLDLGQLYAGPRDFSIVFERAP